MRGRNVLLVAFGFWVGGQVAHAQGILVEDLVGDLEGAQLGLSVSGSGDVDGDLIPDVLAGAPFFDGPGGERSGRVLVFSEATGAQIHSIDGATENDRFGWSVGGVGDVDDDGRADFLVGAPGFDVPGLTNAGRAYLISGLTGAPLFVFDGDIVGGDLGWAVDGAGDVNGDDVPDVIVGQPGFMLPLPQGTVTVFSGATGAPLHVWTVGELGASGNLGRTVSRAGDVNDDGFDDVMFSEGSNLQGGATGLPLHVLPSSPAFGRALAAPGDVDGDGFDDLLVAGGEAAAVFSGATGAVLHVLTTGGDDVRDVGATGDVDGDTLPDVMLSTEFFAGLPDSGGLQIHSGATGALLNVIPPELGSPTGGVIDFDFGASIDVVGDLDGDNVPELTVGTPIFPCSDGSGCGRVQVYALKGDCEDLDGDGTGEPDLPECGFTASPDCDDFDPNNLPGNAEVCDGQDNDCDGASDEGFGADADGDDWGAACDCDDADEDVNPGIDDDQDGFHACEDCDDGAFFVNPGADEIPGNGIDDDCDGEIDEGAPGCAALPADASGASPIGASALALYALALGLLTRVGRRRSAS